MAMTDPVSSENNLSHFSTTPVLEVYSVEQRVSDYRSSYDKPTGLWVSVDGEDDWPSYCEGSYYSISPLRHRVVLADPNRVLHIRGSSALLDFTQEYGDVIADGRVYPDLSIDWKRVAASFAGIIIAPYVWSLRLNERTRWYYGWDCASGCIWDNRAVASIELLRETKAA